MSTRAALLALVLLARHTAAEERPLGITISGGVSLGTWEAGFLYALSEALKADPSQRVRIVTGASAGSANAFITAMSSCLPSNPDPMEDLGWKAWGPVGFTELFDRRRAKESLFVRDPLEASVERAREVWMKGLPEGCDVVFGASVTRVQPRQVEIKAGLSVPRALETFTVRIRGRGPHRPPALSNLVDANAPAPVPLLVLRDDDSRETDEHNFDQLRQVLFASAAFPVAFEPVPISYCLSKPARGERPADLRCTEREFTDLFFDGGLFDNNPLRLSWSLAARALRRTPTGDITWEGEGTPVTPQHLYLDPDTEVYPGELVTKSMSDEAGVLARLFSLSGGIVDSARSRELGALAAEHRDVADHLHLAMSHVPKSSEHLNAFMGFFEREFRRFDFYVGMYDAAVEVRTNPAWQGAALDVERLATSSPSARAGWAPYLCLTSMMQAGGESLRSWCDGDELRSFRILLQVALDRVYQRCQPQRVGPTRVSMRPHYHCARAAEGRSAPRVPGVRELSEDERARRPEESRFDYFIRLLDAYEFEFADLKLATGRADRARVKLRERLDDVVDVWSASQQGLAEQVLAKSGGRAALNALAFSPPTLTGYVTVGTTVQAGMSFARWKPRWLQATGAVGFAGIESLLTEQRPRFSMTLTAGPEVHLVPLSGAVLQPRLAVRGGVQFDAFDRFGFGSCAPTTEGDLIDPRLCTQGVIEVVGVVTFFERLRLHGSWQTFPRLYGRTPSFFTLQFGIGFQFL